MTKSVLGPIATTVLYEDAQIRIWDQRLGPGEKTADHVHENDYVLVDIEGDRLGVTPLTGTQGPFTERIELKVKAGQAYTLRKGSIEVAENIGSTPVRSILIEFKQGDVEEPMY